MRDVVGLNTATTLALLVYFVTTFLSLPLLSLLFMLLTCLSLEVSFVSAIATLLALVAHVTASSRYYWTPEPSTLMANSD